MADRLFVASLKRGAVTLLIVFTLSMLYQRHYYPGEDEAMSGVFAVGAYVAGYIVIEAISAIGKMAYMMVFGVKDLEGVFLDLLRKDQAPYPRPYDVKRLGYLYSLASDQNELPDSRVSAAAIYANGKAMIANAGFWNGIAMAEAIDSAIVRYAQEAPQK